MRYFLLITTWFIIIVLSPVGASEKYLLSWKELPELPPAPGKQIQPGIAGPFAGISNDALIVAGGANFPAPVWENSKEYHDDIYVLTGRNKNSRFKWHTGFTLEYPIAYGASVSTNDGVVCMGGNDSERVFSRVFLVKWLPESKSVAIEYLPDLPQTCTNGAAAQIGNVIYFAGGTKGLGLETATKNFWSLDLDRRPDYWNMPGGDLIALAKRRGILLSAEKEDELRGEIFVDADIRRPVVEQLLQSDSRAVRFSELAKDSLSAVAQQYAIAIPQAADSSAVLAALMKAHWGDFRWQEILPWPGPPRGMNITVAQHNGEADCIYVISGRRYTINAAGEREFDFLTDVYEFNPARYDDPATGEYFSEGRQANPWRKRANAPRCVMAGTGFSTGRSYIFITSGADGSLVHRVDELRDKHPGFPNTALAYHTLTDTWIDAGAIPANQVTTPAVKWKNVVIMASGEIRPRVRSPKIWKIKPLQTVHSPH